MRKGKKTHRKAGKIRTHNKYDAKNKSKLNNDYNKYQWTNSPVKR